MKLSVIIPVYNAERYVSNAVQSALQQPETAEVLLIEDCSPDNSLKICQELEEQYEKVRLLRHYDGQNHGAGATRNLGIENAKYDYIAFLDADDFFLPERFKEAKRLFKIYEIIDGVYEATGVHFYSSEAEKKYFSRKVNTLMTMSAGINTEHLFAALTRGTSGFFHLDGLVVKRNLFKRCGVFFDHLKLHQDTAITIQMSVYGKLISGQLDKPVAKVGIHDQNRILSNYNAFQTRFLLWQTLFMWGLREKITTSRLIILFHNYSYSLFKLFRESRRSHPSSWAPLKSLIHESLKHPILAVGAFIEYISRRLNRFS